MFRLRYLIPLVGLLLYASDADTSGRELVGLVLVNAALLVVIRTVFFA